MRRIEKQQAIVLRMEGKSYNEIRKILNISSKGTLSYWFRNLKLPPDAQRKLADNIAIARKRGLFKFNHDRTRIILRENKEARKVGRKEIGILSQRELLLVGAALYWGEGTKSEKYKNAAVVSLTNSDPLMISLFLRFVREILKVGDEKIRAGILVHHNVDITGSKQFWAGVTKLPIDRFFITKQVSRASKFKRASNTLTYGTVIIKVNKRVLFYKIKGYIGGLCNNIK